MDTYVVQVMTGDEERVKRLAGPELERNGAEILWPRRSLHIRRRGKIVHSVAPVFPGYVIVQTPELTQELLLAVRRTPGVIRFLRSNTDVRRVEGQELAMIRHLLGFGEIAAQSRVRFDENSRIVVVDGPLSGLEGRIVKVDKRKGRAKVKLDLYDESFLIDFGFTVIAPSSS
ncbi:MAG: antiterminator LoaP [Spirochaetales bacterium]